MPLRAVAGLVVACIAAESSAFVYLPTRTAGVVARTSKSRNVNVRTTSLHMGKHRNREIIEEEEAEAGGIKGGAGGAPAEKDDETIPRLVVMDLDYTLWWVWLTYPVRTHQPRPLSFCLGGGTQTARQLQQPCDWVLASVHLST